MKRLTLLGLLFLALFAIEAAAPADSSAYWCPPYSRYCSRNADCRGYCGTGTPPEWEVCEFGCCACLG